MALAQPPATPNLPTPVMRSLRAPDGTLLAYRVCAPRHPRGALLLLNGLTSNHTRWSEFAAGTALRDDWALLCTDLRGQGASVFRGTIGMSQWCADLAALLDAESFPKAVLVGHCLGANLTLAFATRHPERTAGLVLIEPMPDGHAALCPEGAHSGASSRPVGAHAQCARRASPRTPLAGSRATRPGDARRARRRGSGRGADRELWLATGRPAHDCDRRLPAGFALRDPAAACAGTPCRARTCPALTAIRPLPEAFCAGFPIVGSRNCLPATGSRPSSPTRCARQSTTGSAATSKRDRTGPSSALARKTAEPREGDGRRQGAPERPCRHRGRGLACYEGSTSVPDPA